MNRACLSFGEGSIQLFASDYHLKLSFQTCRCVYTLRQNLRTEIGPVIPHQLKRSWSRQKDLRDTDAQKWSRFLDGHIESEARRQGFRELFHWVTEMGGVSRGKDEPLITAFCNSVLARWYEARP